MKITFVNNIGESSTIASEAAETVMRAALDHGIAGIIAECGGSLACATCHVYVEPRWLAHLAPPNEAEKELLDCVGERRPESRLSCQIVLDPSLDGIVVHLPESQF